MAKGDVLIRMKADVSNYDANIAKARKSLTDFKEANLSMGGMVRTATSSLLKFAGGFSAVSGAVKVAGDVFRSNEETMDAWGRTVESAKSVYDGFLYALNTGDISGFLGNINSIVQAARDAYDALDELGTFNAFNQINVEKTRTALTESIADFRSGQGTRETVKAAGEAYKKEMEERKRLEKDAYLAEVKKVAAERGVNYDDLLDAMSGTYGHYQDLKGVKPTGTRTTFNALPSIVGPGMFSGTSTYTYAQNGQERLGEALRKFTDTELKNLQALGAQAERTGNEIAQVDRMMARVLNGREGRGATGNRGGVRSDADRQERLKAEYMSGTGASTYRSRSDLQEELQRQQGALANATNAYDEWAAQSRISDLQWQLSGEGRQAAKIGLDRDSLHKMAETMAASLGDIEGLKFEKVEKSMSMSFEDLSESLRERADLLSGLSGGMNSIVGGLQQLGIEIPEGIQKAIGVMQAVAGILTGISAVVSIIATISGVKATPLFGWLLHTGGVVHAAGGYRVPGNYGYDAVPAMLTSGETVLTRAQAGNLASQLAERNAGQSMQPYVDGETIFLGMNNTCRRMGRGEIVTTSTLKRLGLI